MRYAKPTLVSVAALFVLAIIIGNWRAHRETQSKLDSLAEAFAARPAPPSTPAAPPTPALSEPALLPSGIVRAGGTVPRELDRVAVPLSLIEAPDVLTIEALLRDPRTKQTERLPVQPISGDFVVRPDGTVSLGVWGNVSVAGMTTEKAADAIRRKLAAFTQVNGTSARPDTLVVSVEVKSSNSKAYYVFMESASGEQVAKLPLSGSETVLDAIAAIPGLAAQAEQKQIRVMRKGIAGEPYESLVVNWSAIVQRGDTRTNYVLQPGDRVYVTNGR